jgi:hypothetical protein
VVIAVMYAGTLVGRAQCEQMARENHLVPTGPVRTISEEVTTTQGCFDTRVHVFLVGQRGSAAEGAGREGSGPLVAHVMAFGGFLRKCYFFDFETQLSEAADADVLASRLAVARTRILGGFVLDSFGEVPRFTPTDSEFVPAGR